MTYVDVILLSPVCMLTGILIREVGRLRIRAEADSNNNYITYSQCIF